MLEKIIIYLDNDYLGTNLYHYRSPHFDAARTLGIGCITIIQEDSKNLDSAKNESDKIVIVKSISHQEIVDAIDVLISKYNVAGVFCYPAHPTPKGNANELVESVSRRFGLPIYPAEPIEFCNNKYLMRQALTESSCNLAGSRIFNGVNETLKDILYPIVIKPVYGGGSAFVSICNDENTLLSKYNHFVKNFHNVPGASSFSSQAASYQESDGTVAHYQPGKSILIEDYIDGTEGSVECVIFDGALYPFMVFEKILTAPSKNSIHEKIIVTPPVNMSLTDIEETISLIRSSVTHLNLPNGFFHIEFKVSVNGPQIIEINPRIGGFFVDEAFIDLCGIDPYKMNIQMIINDDSLQPTLDSAVLPILPCDKVYAMVLWYQEKSGYISESIQPPKSSPNCRVLKSVFPKTNGHNDGYFDVDNEEAYHAKFWLEADSLSSVWDFYNAHQQSPSVNPGTDQPKRENLLGKAY